MPMERTLNFETIVEKLERGEKFGLFEESNKCFFEDGSRASYELLWKAVRTVNGIEERALCKSLAEEFPYAFVGVHKHKHSRHNWKKH